MKGLKEQIAEIIKLSNETGKRGSISYEDFYSIFADKILSLPIKGLWVEKKCPECDGLGNWAMMGFASIDHMERSFTQRREQIVGECLSLRNDVDVYNEQNPANNPIQLELDFTEDVAERLVLNNLRFLPTSLSS